MPRPRTRTIASAALGSAVARLKRPTTGYWPGTNTCALESSEPLPLAANVPVKQMPLAWLRRWPSAGPPGGASRSYYLGRREPMRRKPPSRIRESDGDYADDGSNDRQPRNRQRSWWEG